MGQSHSYQVVILGLDNAGKSTTLYRLKTGEYVQPAPTIGFNCEKFKWTPAGQGHRCATISVWDVGGQERQRPLWRSYAKHTDALVFVVDASEPDRFEECRLELAGLLRNGAVPPRVPVLVLANKQDLPAAVPEQQVEAALGLNDQSGGQRRPKRTLPCCAVTGEGLDATFDVLLELIAESRRLEKEAGGKGKGVR